MHCQQFSQIPDLSAPSLRTERLVDKKRIWLACSACLVAITAGCSASPPPSPSKLHAEHDSGQLLALLSSRSSAVNKGKLDAEVAHRPEIDTFIRHYTGIRRKFMQLGLERARYYRPTIDRILRKHGLPTELCGVALVESGFDPLAESPSGAVGVWQLMKLTARSLGLSVNWFSDERTDVHKSTDAAARYLLKLYKMFDSWPLALAAYNGGMTRVSKAVRDAGTRDFFELAERGYFRRETREFVPKVYAAMIILDAPASYGFD